jgi:hypothetical protein
MASSPNLLKASCLNSTCIFFWKKSVGDLVGRRVLLKLCWRHSIGVFSRGIVYQIPGGLLASLFVGDDVSRLVDLELVHDFEHARVECVLALYGRIVFKFMDSRHALHDSGCQGTLVCPFFPGDAVEGFPFMSCQIVLCYGYPALVSCNEGYVRDNCRHDSRWYLDDVFSNASQGSPRRFLCGPLWLPTVVLDRNCGFALSSSLVPGLSA